MKKYVMVFGYFFILIVFLFNFEFVKAEELSLSYGTSKNFTSNSDICKSNNSACVSANITGQNVTNGIYTCTIRAVKDNCSAQITAGAKIYDITVGNPSQSTDDENAEYINLNLKLNESSNYIVGASTCYSNNSSCVITNVEPLPSGAYNCYLKAINANCSATVRAGAGNGLKIITVKTSTNESTSSDELEDAPTNIGNLTCDYLLGGYDSPEYIGYYLAKLLEYIKFCGPILVVVMTIVDSIKVIALGKPDEINKLAVKSLKRIIYGVLLFIIPVLLDSLFKIFSVYGVCLSID